MEDKKDISDDNNDPFEQNSGARSNRKKRIGVISIFGFGLILVFIFLIFYPFGVQLVLLGESKISVEVHTVYEEPGFTAFYKNDDISADVIISNEVDTDTLGIYTIAYTYKAKGKFKNTIKRTIEVVDTTPAAITLRGGEQTVVIINSEYTEILLYNEKDKLSYRQRSL